MRWVFSAALLPFVVCGAMCFGGALLAALGLRHGVREASRDASRTEAPSRPSEQIIDR
jgi:hypothetical protein